MSRPSPGADTTVPWHSCFSGMLGLPSCSHTTWHKMVEDLEVHVTNVAEWSCSCVRGAIEERGNKNKWVASFDGFYLTGGSPL